MTAHKCTMPTANLGLCKREARYVYVGDGTGSTTRVVAAYCAQHANATTGHARLLRPLPWEYDQVVVSA